jgi:hypothetical protein
MFFLGVAWRSSPLPLIKRSYVQILSG